MDGERALRAARDSDLIGAGRPLLVLLSGGADSVCLLDVAVRLGAEVTALHVNYGLREGAAADERLCAELCRRLGAGLVTESVRLPEAEGTGNLQAAAREARYALAERWVAARAAALGAPVDYATAHTASDQAETVVHRLAASPGRRALLGMAPRRGRLVRPLLRAERADTLAWCEARGLRWREDPSNADPRFARARVRHEVMPVLRQIAPGAERTIAATAEELRDEQEVLDRAVTDALHRLGPAVRLDELHGLAPALARLALRRLLEEAAGEPRSLSREEAARVLALGRSGGSAALDLGGGVRAIAEYGLLRFTREPDAGAPPPVALPVPGTARFGGWEVEARPVDRADLPAPGDDAVVGAAALAAGARVRAWRSGDRMRPAGLGGSKSLQDLFTDRKVPRALRRTLPVVEAGGEIVWVAGVAVSEAARPGEGPLMALSARRTGPP